MFLAFICEWNNDFAPFCTAHKTCSIFLSFALSLLLIFVLFHIKKREYNKFLSFSMWNGFHFCKCFHFDNKNCTNYYMQADPKEQLKWCAFFIQPNEIRIKKNVHSEFSLRQMTWTHKSLLLSLSLLLLRLLWRKMFYRKCVHRSGIRAIKHGYGNFSLHYSPAYHIIFPRCCKILLFFSIFRWKHWIPSWFHEMIL